MKIGIFVFLLSFIIISINPPYLKAQSILEVYIGLSPLSMYSSELGNLRVSIGDNLWVKTSKSALINLISPTGKLITSVYYDPKVWDNYPILLYNFTDRDYFGVWKINVYSDTGLLQKSIEVEYIDNSLKIYNFNYSFNFSSDTIVMKYNFTINKSDFFNNSKYYLLLLTSSSYVNYTGSIVRALIGGAEIPARPIGIGYFNIEQNIIESDKEINIKVKPIIFNETVSQRTYVIENFDYKLYYYTTFYKESGETEILTYVPVLIQQSSLKNFKINQDSIIIKLPKGNIRTVFLTWEFSFNNRTPYIEFSQSSQIILLNNNTQTKIFFILDKKELDLKNNTSLISGEAEFDPMLIFNLLQRKQENILKDLYLGISLYERGILGIYPNKIKADFFALNFVNLVDNSIIKNFEIEGNIKIKNFRGNVIGIGNLTEFSLILNKIKLPKTLLFLDPILIEPYQYRRLDLILYKLNLTIMSGSYFIYNTTLTITYLRYNMQLFNSTVSSYNFTALLPPGNYNIKVKKEGFEDFEMIITLDSNKIIYIDLKPIPENSPNETYDASLILLFSLILLIEVVANLYVYYKIRSLRRNL